MFAIIEDGSRQIKVSKGSLVKIDYRADANAGDKLTFDSVLLANGGGASSIGAPLISGATVMAEVVDAEVKGEKLEIQKFRRRKNSRTHTGHRQKYTSVKIAEISVPGLEEKSE
ncbi:50S ribosomal protein L21 [Polystyrenella longa]|uniref:Large ribosomal subunit protein bL21 n=1 Tax=Polystyrenella longa TaxID=2528007 RepID=A0A518CJR5_9PLAN|nr:50S ribosomal protein L21 [Polystyrenella longa]QDU79478.1 50S ribosomal protein L21 [Polystyrenella longa]